MFMWPIKGFKDLDYALFSIKKVSQKFGSCGWGPGPSNLGQNCLSPPHLWRHTQKNEIQNFPIFIQIHTRRLATSFQGLNGSLAQPLGTLTSCKLACKILPQMWFQSTSISYPAPNVLRNAFSKLFFWPSAGPTGSFWKFSTCFQMGLDLNQKNPKRYIFFKIYI